MANEKRLSALAVKSAGAGRHADGGSLYLEVTASGSRRWLYRYRSGAKVKDMALGDAAILSLKDARDLRDKWRRELTLGRDPVETRRSEKAAGVTFGEVADEVIALKERDLRNDKAAAQWKMTLTYTPSRYEASQSPRSQRRTCWQSSARCGVASLIQRGG